MHVGKPIRRAFQIVNLCLRVRLRTASHGFWLIVLFCRRLHLVGYGKAQSGRSAPRATMDARPTSKAKSSPRMDLSHGPNFLVVVRAIRK